MPVAQQTSYGARSCAPSPIAWEHDAVVPGRLLWSDGCVFSGEVGSLERFEESLLIYYMLIQIQIFRFQDIYIICIYILYVYIYI